MYYLYGSKRAAPGKLVATFDSEQQLRSYVRWATLGRRDGTFKFEQGSSLVGCDGWTSAAEPLTDDDPAAVDHNPTPSML